MSSFYDRLTQLAKAGEWKEALALMRLTGLPAMTRAFRTTVAGGGRYEMIFRFGSIEELHAADAEWHDFRAASGTEAQRATTVQQGVVHDGPVAKPRAQGDAQ